MTDLTTDELRHLHELLRVIVDYIEAEDISSDKDTPSSIDLQHYDSLGIGPYDFNSLKTEQQKAVFTLVGDINRHFYKQTAIEIQNDPHERRDDTSKSSSSLRLKNLAHPAD